MDIYWIKDKRKCGPTTVPDVISLVQMGELTPDSLGWHAGCPRWMPLRELPALADFLTPSAAQAEQPDEDNEEDSADAPETAPQPASPQQPPTPVAPAAESAAAPELSQRVYLPSPTVRLFARLVDSVLYAVLLYGAFYLQQVPYDRALLPSDNPLLWLPMVLLEAILLARWGTTPGKALMGIRVHTFPENGRPSFLRALGRSIIVFVLGMGMMYTPLLMPLMIVLSYWRLRRIGITSWDARCSTLTVQQKPATPSRFVLAVITLYVGITVLGSCMLPWFGPILEDINKENPQAAATLRGMMPPELLPAESQQTPAAPQQTQQTQQGPPQLRI